MKWTRNVFQDSQEDLVNNSMCCISLVLSWIPVIHMVGGKEPAPANYPLTSTLSSTDTGTHIIYIYTHTQFFETEPVLEHTHTQKEMSYNSSSLLS